MYRKRENRPRISFEDFKTLSDSEKADFFTLEGNIYHLIASHQLSRELLDDLSDLATRIRKIAKARSGMVFLKSLLEHKRAMLYFLQPSSRTFLSHFSACQIVGIHPAEMRNPGTSSEMKGESQEDTVRTLASYFDLIIVRHPEAGFAERIAWKLGTTDRPVPVINAGSGKDEHPTQALLDIYTLNRSFEHTGGIDGKHIVIVGDLARGRTARSLAKLLSLYDDVKITFVSPEKLSMGNDVKQYIQRNNANFFETEDFMSVIPDADAIYMMRIQDEYKLDNGETAPTELDYTKYHFTKKHLKLLKPHAVIMHPLPRRNEIEVEVDDDPRAVYWRQVRNGMWVRVALIAKIFKQDKRIRDFYENNF